MKQLKQSKQPKQLNNIDNYPIFINKDYAWTDDNFCLKESDFNPPSDYRIWKSNIDDIEGGDNFADYCAEFFKMLDDEDYWES